jgi:K+/H+ antiporter YhaU regulatory subunit KhtT
MEYRKPGKVDVRRHPRRTNNGLTIVRHHNRIYPISTPVTKNHEKIIKNLNYDSAKRIFPWVKPNKDYDKDGVKNKDDCRPFDKDRQDIIYVEKGQQKFLDKLKNIFGEEESVVFGRHSDLSQDFDKILEEYKKEREERNKELLQKVEELATGDIFGEINKMLARDTIRRIQEESEREFEHLIKLKQEGYSSRIVINKGDIEKFEKNEKIRQKEIRDTLEHEFLHSRLKENGISQSEAIMLYKNHQNEKYKKYLKFRKVPENITNAIDKEDEELAKVLANIQGYPDEKKDVERLVHLMIKFPQIYKKKYREKIGQKKFIENKGIGKIYTKEEYKDKFPTSPEVLEDI